MRSSVCLLLVLAAPARADSSIEDQWMARGKEAAAVRAPVALARSGASAQGIETTRHLATWALEMALSHCAGDSPLHGMCHHEAVDGGAVYAIVMFVRPGQWTMSPNLKIDEERFSIEYLYTRAGTLRGASLQLPSWWSVLWLRSAPSRIAVDTGSGVLLSFSLDEPLSPGVIVGANTRSIK